MKFSLNFSLPNTTNQLAQNTKLNKWLESHNGKKGKVMNRSRIAYLAQSCIAAVAVAEMTPVAVG